ncbi:unnamed protein product [Polarella glacialis]|uniref:Uncharacterized protein n=1 Tax=Polarella glacialis TaxID=89957 RepID=A0A813FAZ5_POLGL|nr:unnamed protein product [Polarella glacialis]CAE8608318.1 unnamed protein product [Polarella glacialis]
MREAMHQGIATHICAQLHASIDMRFLATTIQGDLRCRLIMSCATHHHHPRYKVTCMAQMPSRYCNLSAVSKLRASSANLKFRTDLQTSLSECRVAAEILSPSFNVPTDNNLCCSGNHNVGG